MADAKQFVFAYKEVAEALVKQQGIHEGIWGIYMEFGIQGANIGSDPGDASMLPAAIIPVLKLGLQRFEKENNLSVDAGRVNPEPA
jgi:hypothetical protein